MPHAEPDTNAAKHSGWVLLFAAMILTSGCSSGSTASRIANELSSLRAEELLALSVLGTVVTVIGSLIATVLKDYLFARSFESWKSKQSLLAIYRGYRDPITLASLELLSRLREMTFQAQVPYSDRRLLEVDAKGIAQNAANDPYYLKYKLVSTVYRLCALLGWFELYRKEVTFLNTGKSRRNRRLESCIEKFRSALADGHLNDADDWLQWRDILLFREEQRAIGGAMIEDGGQSRSVMSYATFCDVFLSGESTGKGLWLQKGASFLLDLSFDKKEKDFRRARCLLMLQSLIELLELLDRSRVDSKLMKAKRDAADELGEYAIYNEKDS